MRRIVLTILATLALSTFALSTFAKAQPLDAVEGADDPAFQTALHLWLDDKDGGIRQLLDLANTDNPAAAILISKIPWQEKQRVGIRGIDTNFHFEDIMEISEFARIWGEADGMVPDSIVRLATANEPAEALRRLVGPGHGTVRPAEIPSLLALSELPLSGSDPAIAFMTALPAYVDQNIDSRVVVDWMRRVCHQNDLAKDPFRPTTMVCISPGGNHMRSLLQALFGMAADSHHQVGDVTQHLPAIAVWLANGSRTKAYRTICKQVCPSTPNQCLPELFEHSSGLSGFFSLITPVQRLVPQDRYAASGFAIGSLWREQRRAHRLIQQLERESGARLPPYPPKLACLAEAIETGGTPWDRPEPVE